MQDKQQELKKKGRDPVEDALRASIDSQRDVGWRSRANKIWTSVKWVYDQLRTAWGIVLAIGVAGGFLITTYPNYSASLKQIEKEPRVPEQFEFKNLGNRSVFLLTDCRSMQCCTTSADLRLSRRTDDLVEILPGQSEKLFFRGGGDPFMSHEESCERRCGAFWYKTKKDGKQDAQFSQANCSG